ncbi:MULTISPECIES: FAD-dependent oxidoreductase [Rhizobium/Agrobacterium group]|uniref:FAD-dependent oxidoreductase n=1 Tax=Rhizobium/Agrobacterium group TaxID=227290 RepID=UPI001EEF38E5|nr:MULTISPECIES: FAD-dependent oxidoreductase [Rhizobium/Agrobacterium group]
MSKSDSCFDADVVIVGGGPVGTGLAIELAQRNVSTIVIEKFPQPQQVPKGQNLTQRTMEHFHFWGAEPQLRDSRTVPEKEGIGGLTAYGTLLGEYQYDWLQRDLVQQYYFRKNERLPQYKTERVLRNRLKELASARAMYGWSGTEVDQDATGVNVTISSDSTQEQRILRARYVVGCDGSRSVIRQKAGITQTLADHDKLMVLLVFRSKGLHQHLARYPKKSFYNTLHPSLDGYWQFFGRVDFGETWFFHAPLPEGVDKDKFDYVSYLHNAVGAPFDVEIEYKGFWDLRFAIADSYQSGRIFVAGDAAHSHPPYGGYGINSGFEDARNLGWKLAATIQGWGGENLLGTYSSERHPVFVSTAKDFIARAIEEDRKFLKNYDPLVNRAAFEAEWAARSVRASSEVDAFEPHYGGSSVICGQEGDATSALGSHEHRARPGHHLSPAVLSDHGNVFDALGPGFTLLFLDTAEQDDSLFAAAASALNLPLKIIRDNSTSFRDRYKARYVLVRPDQFVAWASDEIPTEPARILRQVSGFRHGADVKRDFEMEL